MPVFVLAVIGVIAFLISRAPFIEGTIKQFIIWALIFIGAVYLIYWAAGVLGI